MLTNAKKKKDLLAKAGLTRADEEVTFEFSALGDLLGFNSPNIQTLKQQLLDREIARNALGKAYKPDCNEYDEIIFEASIALMVRLFTAALIPCKYSSPALVSDNLNISRNLCRFTNDEPNNKTPNSSLYNIYQQER